jgi:hypothetical protein
MRRVDVNLDELDQIIDRSTRAPLSESEGQKLKTALHAMAERLILVCRGKPGTPEEVPLPKAGESGQPGLERGLAPADFRYSAPLRNPTERTRLILMHTHRLTPEIPKMPPS